MDDFVANSLSTTHVSFIFFDFLLVLGNFLHSMTSFIGSTFAGNGPGFVGMVNSVPPACGESNIFCMMPMWLWSQPPLVVGMVVSIAINSRVSWFMSSLVGCLSIFETSMSFGLSLISCLIPMV